MPMTAVDTMDKAAPAAAEPSSAVDATGHTTERSCLNCATPLVGDYCHACGQRGHVHRSLGAFGHDLLHGVFHFEGKVWRTLPMLAWRPGELTRRYVDGQRAGFVSPIALFLFGVFLMFAVVSWTGGGIRVDGSLARADVERGLAADERQIEELERERAAAAAEGRPTTTLDARIAEQRRDLDTARRILSEGVIGEGTTVVTPLDSLNRAWLQARKNPDLLLFKLKSNGYKYSWALIPLSLPLMWLLFPFSRRWRMYDHMVFVTYSLSFMTLLVVAVSLVAALGATNLWSLAMLLPPIHIYRQLRGAYLLPRPSALWRAAVLSVGALVIALLFGLGLLFAGIS